jgi:hypothetical protein
MFIFPKVSTSKSRNCSGTRLFAPGKRNPSEVFAGSLATGDGDKQKFHVGSKQMSLSSGRGEEKPGKRGYPRWTWPGDFINGLVAICVLFG